MYPKKTEVSQQKSPGPSLNYQDHRGRQFEAGRPEKCRNRKATEKMPMVPTLFSRITGPGKIPEASVALGFTGPGERYVTPVPPLIPRIQSQGNRRDEDVNIQTRV
jgi:hypothetical protein